MTRRDLMHTIDTYVDARTETERAKTEDLRAKIMILEAELETIRASQQGVRIEDVSFEEMQRVVRGYNSVHTGGHCPKRPGLHERMARALLARMNQEASEV